MTNGEDWLMRPVLRGMCKFESLKDGTLDLCDVATMNEAIDVEEENRMRCGAWIRKHGG
jgi:hypothetical protein